MIIKKIISIILIINLLPVYSQLDLEEKAQLIGMQADHREGAAKGEKLTDLSFIFIDRPSVYYHNRKDDVVTLEFYDAVIGDQELPKINKIPFKSTTVTETKVDINKDIEGLAPEFKEVVKVEIILDTGITFDYSVTDDFNVITLSSVWTKGKKLVTKKTREKEGKAWPWVVGGIVGVTAGTVLAIMLGTEKPETESENDKEWGGDLPGLPSIETSE